MNPFTKRFLSIFSFVTAPLVWYFGWIERSRPDYGGYAFMLMAVVMLANGIRLWMSK